MSALALAGAPAYRKYVAVGQIAIRQRLDERFALVAQTGLYAVFLLIFSRLWEVVLQGQHTPGRGPTEYLWYLAVTEWLILSLPRLYLDIERDVRTGDLAYHLTRPTSYLTFKISEALSEMLLRMSVLGIAGIGFAYLFTGSFPSDPRGLLLALPLGLLSGFLLVLTVALIGLCAFWLQECRPLYFVWQKGLLVLGGVMLPLSIYPGWLRDIALATPYAAMMNGPAQMVFGFDLPTALGVATRLLAWIAVTLGVLVLVYRRGLRILNVNGG